MVGEDLSKFVANKIKNLKASEKFSKKISIVNFPSLKDNEYLICSATEVLYKHCHEGTKVESFSDYIKTKKETSEDIKDVNTSNDDEIDNDKKVIQKRVSYRAKANEVGDSNLVKNRTDKSDLKKQKIKNMKVLQDNKTKKEEKKQGWWTQ